MTTRNLSQAQPEDIDQAAQPQPETLPAELALAKLALAALLTAEQFAQLQAFCAENNKSPEAVISNALAAWLEFFNAEPDRGAVMEWEFCGENVGWLAQRKTEKRLSADAAFVFAQIYERAQTSPRATSQRWLRGLRAIIEGHPCFADEAEDLDRIINAENNIRHSNVLKVGKGGAL